jgi:hypothetical protein
VATFVVRDEVETIGLNIEHCLALGFHHVLVTDNRSVDGTSDLLAEYHRGGAITWISQPSDEFHQGRWVTAMARLAAERHGADWVFNLDADEFLWSPHGRELDSQNLIGNALAAVPRTSGFFNLRRQDMRPDPLAHSSHWLELNTLRDLDTRSWRSGRPLGPKAVHRGDPAVEVSDGNHFASGPAIPPRGDWTADMVLLHFPDRGRRHYERKIRNGGPALTKAGLQSGVHWQEDYRRLEGGTLWEEYERRQLSADELPALLASGRIVRETAFRTRMLELQDRLPRNMQAAITSSG